MYLLYSLLLTAAALVGSPYWIYKAIRDKKYIPNFRQRLGLKLPPLPDGTRPVWVHCVSVGEVLAAKPLVSSIHKARPALPVVCSTVTLTGQALAEKELPQAANIFYFPFDWTFSVRRFLERVQPCAVVLMETELWPNFLRACARKGIPVFVANGRLSDRSLRRYRRVRMLSRPDQASGRAGSAGVTHPRVSRWQRRPDAISGAGSRGNSSTLRLHQDHGTGLNSLEKPPDGRRSKRTESRICSQPAIVLFSPAPGLSG